MLHVLLLFIACVIAILSPQYDSSAMGIYYVIVMPRISTYWLQAVALNNMMTVMPRVSTIYICVCNAMGPNNMINTIINRT